MEHKKEILQHQLRIFTKKELPKITVEQIVTVIYRFEMILGNADTSTMIRVKLYELLSTFIRLDQKEINTALAEQ